MRPRAAATAALLLLAAAAGTAAAAAAEPPSEAELARIWGPPSKQPLYRAAAAAPCTVLANNYVSSSSSSSSSDADSDSNAEEEGSLAARLAALDPVAAGWHGCRSQPGVGGGSTAGGDSAGRLWPLTDAAAARAFLGLSSSSSATNNGTDDDDEVATQKKKESSAAAVPPPPGGLVLVVGAGVWTASIGGELLAAASLARSGALRSRAAADHSSASASASASASSDDSFSDSFSEAEAAENARLAAVLARCARCTDVAGVLVLSDRVGVEEEGDSAAAGVVDGTGGEAPGLARPAAFSPAGRSPQAAFSLYADAAASGSGSGSGSGSSPSPSPSSSSSSSSSEGGGELPRVWNPAGTGWARGQRYGVPVWLLASAGEAAADAGRAGNPVPGTLLDGEAAGAAPGRPEGPALDSASVLALAEQNRAACIAVAPPAEAKATATGGAGPMWGARLETFMEAGRDSTECKRRRACQNVGSWSVWGTPGAGYDSAPSRSLANATSQKAILVMAGVDSTSFFHARAPGARSSVSGTVAALAAAAALQRGGFAARMRLQPVFALFQAEQWGYQGSRSFVRDVQLPLDWCEKRGDSGGSSERNCDEPRFVRDWGQLRHLDLDQFEVAMELQQFGAPVAAPPNANPLPAGARGSPTNSPATMYVHNDPTTSGTAVDSLTEALAAGAALADTPFTVQRASVPAQGSRQLPPSSMMAFLAAKPGFPGVVFGEFDQTYLNQYHHSRFDDATNIHAPTVCAAAKAAAIAIWRVSQGATTTGPDGGLNVTGLEVDCDEVAELIHCLTTSYNCSLGRELLFPPGMLDPKSKNYTGDVGETLLPPMTTQYASVHRSSSLNSISQSLIHNFFFDLLAYNRSGECVQDADCGLDTVTTQPTRCIRGQCLNSNVFFHDAVALGLVGDKETRAPGLQSTWTESDWSGIYVVVFTMDDLGNEIAFLISGVVFAAGSIFAVLTARKHLERLAKQD